MKIKEIEVDDLNLPENPGLAPQIVWGSDFEEWEEAQQIRYLKKLCSALNHATDLIQKERNGLLDQLHEMNEILENADKNIAIQKAIVHKAITGHNEEKQYLAGVIKELEGRIKVRDEILKSYGHKLED